MDCYNEIIRRAEKELEDVTRTPRDGFQNMDELKKVDLLAHTIKSAYGAMKLRDELEGGSYGGGYEIDRPATHDRMGRLPGAYRGGSYRGSMGRSYGGGDYVMYLEQAMEAAQDDQEREHLREMIRNAKR